MDPVNPHRHVEGPMGTSPKAANGSNIREIASLIWRQPAHESIGAIRAYIKRTGSKDPLLDRIASATTRNAEIDLTPYPIPIKEAIASYFPNIDGYSGPSLGSLGKALEPYLMNATSKEQVKELLDLSFNPNQAGFKAFEQAFSSSQSLDEALAAGKAALQPFYMRISSWFSRGAINNENATPLQPIKIKADKIEEEDNQLLQRFLGTHVHFNKKETPIDRAFALAILAGATDETLNRVKEFLANNSITEVSSRLVDQKVSALSSRQ